MTGSSSGGEMSAWDIMQMMDSGRGDEAVEILSGGGNADPVAEERGTFEVILPASSMKLPDGGWIELEIAGDAYFKGTAFPGPDGNVRFTVPRQRIGAIITVSLTAFLPDGTPYICGSKTGPAEEDGGASFAVPLEDLPAIIIGFGGDGAANGNTAEQGGDSYEVMEYSSRVSLNILSTIADATLEIKVNGADAAASQTLSDGFNDISVTATMGEGKPPVTASKKVYVVKKLVKPVITKSGGTANGKTASSGGKSYQVIEYETSLPTVTVTNSYDGDGAGTTPSVFTVTHNGSTSSASMTLSDGFNAIVATLEKEHCGTLTDEKYYYVVKKLVKPTITKSGGTANGKTATGSDGKSYTVIEYEGTLPTVTVTNSYDGDADYVAKLGSSVIASSCPETKTVSLADGFNAVTATLSRDYCDTLKEEKYYYVVKALSEDDIDLSLCSDLTHVSADDSGGYECWKYSFLNDGTHTFSVTNNTVDAAATGSTTMTVKLDGTTLTGETGTGNISDEGLADGEHTITVTLTKSYCSSVSKEKKLRIKIKPVTVSMTSITMDYSDDEPNKWVNHQAYIQATNADGSDSDRKEVFNMNGTQFNAPATLTVDASAVLTAPDSTFRFWTTNAYCMVSGHPSFGLFDWTWTLDDLKTPANRIVDDQVWGDANGHGTHYNFTFTVTDD